MKAIKISKGVYGEDGKLTVCKNPGTATVAELEELAGRLAGYLLKIELTEVSSYDDSDDDRWGCSTDTYHNTVYAELDPMEDGEALLKVDGEFVGVVFRVEPKSRYGEVSLCAFTFDGSVAQRATLGHSASHSSEYVTVERMTLVPRGQNGAPEKGKCIRFSQHESYPSF